MGKEDIQKQGGSMEEYLTTEELSDRIKLAPGTIRNMVYRGQFKLGIHYVKTGPRKLLFLWSGIADFLHGGTTPEISDSRQ
jgi:hypothetical protein